MWIKKRLSLSALCLLFALLPSLCLAQASSSATATWQSFDGLISALKAEIENLNLQIIEAQKSLTVSQDELRTLKATLQEREIQLAKYENSLRQSKASLLKSEDNLQRSERFTFVLLITQAMSLIGIGYLLFH